MSAAFDQRVTLEAESNRHGLRHFLLYVVVPTTAGALVYVFFRSTGLLAFRWLSAIGLYDVAMECRHSVLNIHLPDWLVFSVPDGLWVFALTSWIIQVWHGRPPCPWLLAGLVLAVGSELGQAASIVPGTYQHEDIFCYVAGFLLALLRLR